MDALRKSLFGSSLLVILSQIVACTTLTEDPEGTSHDELAADRNPLPTTQGTIKAGDPYTPVIDERPLAIDGEASCVKSPRVEFTTGRTELDAKVVASRRDLLNRLDLGVEGIPINVAKLTGATGTARLAVETRLDETSLNIIFQARGSFESSIAGVGEVPKFDPKRIDRCGWGYVKKAHHRLAAIVMVTIESTDQMRRVLVGCGQGEENCTGTSISAGAVQAKASIENTLKAGKYNVSIRTLSDAIPGLPDKPLGDIVELTDASGDDKKIGETMSKLSNALNWLGQAETAIQKHIDTIKSDPTKGSAPTTKVEFAYYEGVSDEQKTGLHTTYDNVIKLRDDYETTLTRAAKWEAFKTAKEEGYGPMFNVPGSPLATLEEVDARADEAIGEEGILKKRRDELDAAFMRCESAVKKDDIADITKKCTKLPAASWEKEYDAKYGVKRLAPLSVQVDTYKGWPFNNCPDGQRLPKIEEQKLLSPYSFVTSTKEDKGIWLERENAFSLAPWIKSGKFERTPLVVWTSPKHVTMCFPNGGLFEGAQ
jgi:hypothetical protein